MVFDYNQQKVFTQSIDVVDIGNFSLRCKSSTKFYEYYLITRTVMGKVGMVKFGPVLPDINGLVDQYNVVYKQFDFKETTICKEVNAFINDPKKEIDEIEEITEYEAIECLPEITVDTIMA